MYLFLGRPYGIQGMRYLISLSHTLSHPYIYIPMHTYIDTHAPARTNERTDTGVLLADWWYMIRGGNPVLEAIPRTPVNRPQYQHSLKNNKMNKN